MQFSRKFQVMAASLISKFRGCLMGSHMGDCLGAPFEGDGTVSKAVLTKFIASFSKEDGATKTQMFPYTDDTAMTFSMAKSLVENKGLNPTDLATKFVQEYVNQPRRGYGENVVDVFHKLADNDFSDVYGPATRQFSGSGSYGNGAAMRIAPAALFCHNREFDETLEIVKGMSVITHTHQNGLNGAILQCLAINQALKMDPSAPFDAVQFVTNLLNKMETIETPLSNVRSLDDARPYCIRLKKIKDMLTENKTPSTEAIASKLGNNVSAHESVPTAVYSFLRGLQPLENFESDNPFMRTLFFAIAVGGDTDTIAAMAGSIAGAYHGDGVIPGDYIKRCEAMEDSQGLAVELHALVSASTG